MALASPKRWVLPQKPPRSWAAGTAARLDTVCLFCPTPSSLAKGLHYDHHSLQIEMWTLDRVRPYENNPRNNDKAVDAVAASIKFGFSQPIVVDTDSVIIVGHTRLKAAQKLGLERVPVVVASHLRRAGSGVSDRRQQDR